MTPKKKLLSFKHEVRGGVANGGDEEWRTEDGLLHRVGGPAVQTDGGVSRGGSEEYWLNDTRFNPNGPSATWYGPLEKGGDEQWTNEEGDFHRIGGPAIQWGGGVANGGTEEWYVNGECHREDGPAFTRFVSEGEVEEFYFLHGVRFDTVEEFESALAHLRRTTKPKTNVSS